MMFVNREKEISRIKFALQASEAQMIVIYGRRRVGKTAMIRELIDEQIVFYSADLRQQPLQIATLAKQVENILPGFSKPIYPDWDTILRTLNSSLNKRITLCLDEFPYLVKNSPELPSILQNIVDDKAHDNINFILCGSSQQMMYDLVLEKSSPLYGRSNEIIKLKSMNIANMIDFLSINEEASIAEFGIWGGVPRYWEIRKSSGSLVEAVKHSVIDSHGILFEEPERLFSDEMRTSVQAYSVLILIGAGCHRLSEIAGRLGKPATQLSGVLNFLINLGYIRRETPFGDSIRSTKKSLYKIDDLFLNFYFRFVIPNKSRLDYGLVDQVWQDIEKDLGMYTSEVYEELCRKSIPYFEIFGKRFNPASRWWGNGINQKPMEIDIVAESVDKSSLLVAEVKWTNSIDLEFEINRLNVKCENLPFGIGQKIYKVLFVKSGQAVSDIKFQVFTPKEVVNSFRCM
ncbi:MAG: ATP-binding protein [Bacteroidales bacterium]|nr:ATP-binding protein [Bacteroidales bacterium]MCF8454908.1 ATP-binding protein [Bacteroidales bacterium]